MATDGKVCDCGVQERLDVINNVKSGWRDSALWASEAVLLSDVFLMTIQKEAVQVTVSFLIAVRFMLFSALQCVLRNFNFINPATWAGKNITALCFRLQLFSISIPTSKMCD